jgi:hypothetical protein
MDVELGKAIIQNSSLQILLKQSSAAIEKVAKVFYLSEGEQHLLLSCETGQGLFFAGPAHAGIRVIASPEEHSLVTTKPQELEAMREKAKLEKLQIAPAPPKQAPLRPSFGGIPFAEIPSSPVSQPQLKTPPMTTVVVEDLPNKVPGVVSATSPQPIPFIPPAIKSAAPAVPAPVIFQPNSASLPQPKPGQAAADATRPLFTVVPIDSGNK